MSAREFEFDLYRLVIKDREDDLFADQKNSFSGDADILRVFEHITSEDFDEITETPNSTFKWSSRSYIHFESADSDPEITCFTLARSALEQTGPVVNKDSITVERIQQEQSIANIVRIIFHIKRHLVAIEHNSSILSSNKWLSVLHLQLDKACDSLGFRNQLRLEPKPKNDEVMKIFNSFSHLTRFRAHLRLPNPEVDRHAKKLFDEMTSAKIRDFLLDIRNVNGLNVEAGSFANSAARLVEAGYKDGSATLEGYKDGKKTKVQTGKKAARGRIARLKDFIRGQETIAKTQEARIVLSAIISEIDIISPPTDTS